MSKNSEKQWISQIFQANAARSGGIVRRKLRDIEKFASMDELRTAVRRRGFDMLVRGEDVVILCASQNMQRAG